MQHFRRRRERTRGQSLVEFTLVLPIFLAVLLGIAEGGYYIAATTAVSHATHEGARLGVLESTADGAAVRSRVAEAAAVIVSVPTSDVSLRLNGLACDDTCYGGRANGDRLGVRTTYTHRPLIGYIFGDLTFSSDASAELLVE